MYKWDEMSPRERDALVQEKVFGIPFMGYPKYYTTDISAAWEVVLKMRDKGYDMVLVVGIDYVEATFYPQQSTQYSSRIVDDSAPEVICLAALKAVGVDVG